MSFSSSPELRDGTEIDGTAGAILMGGQIHDAARIAQLEALRAAQSDEVARRQARIEIEQQEIARIEADAAEQQRILAEKKLRQREEVQSFTCFFIVISVLVVLVYKAYQCAPASPNR